MPRFLSYESFEGENTRKWVPTGANGHYLIGDFDGAQFEPEGTPEAADTGANYYAVQTYGDIQASDGEAYTDRMDVRRQVS